jgi:glycoprotein 3-alpha-L-fucosyltransferase
LDSDIVNAYERWEYYDQNVKRQPPNSPAADINYAANKTKQVGAKCLISAKIKYTFCPVFTYILTFDLQFMNCAFCRSRGLSNCRDRNGRLLYAQELSKHISVDIYGNCGTKTCPRSTPNSCFEMLKKEYKFYLAFENSNCKDYITEKFFNNALR